jgi:site-specific DNA-methyltransferase (adenine-specific)
MPLIPKYQLYNEDCLIVMSRLSDSSVDLVVTSPPYGNLRTYLGFIFDFESTAIELYRILKPGGVVVWVVADQTIKGSESGTSFKQALYFKEIGFRLHDTMIYAKKAPVPLTHNRYEQQFEYMFILSKYKPKTFNGLVEPCLNVGKPNSMRHRRSSDELENSSGYSKPINPVRLRYNIWYYQKDNSTSLHPATFPIQLAIDHIMSWSNINDIVFDPFMGSGTTGVACGNLGRRFIGCDVSTEYVNLATERIAKAYAQAKI